MAENNINAHCAICNKGYHICHSCSGQKALKPWRSVTDTMEHYKIYLAIHGYTISKDKESAKGELKNCDLSSLENFDPEVKSVIKKIMAENKKVKTAAKKEVVNAEIEAKKQALIE